MDAAGAENRNPGCLVGLGGHTGILGTSNTPFQGVVLGDRNIQHSVHRRWGLEHVPSAAKAKMKRSFILLGWKTQPRKVSWKREHMSWALQDE